MAERMAHRKAEKAARGSRAQGQQEEKGKGQESGQRRRKKAAGTQEKTQKEQGAKIDENTGRMEMEEKLWMVNRTQRNRNMGRELDKGIETAQEARQSDTPEKR